MTRRLLAVFVGLTLLVLLVHDLPLAGHLRAVERDRLVTSLERDAFTFAGLAEEDLEAIEEGRSDDRTLLVDLADSYRDRTGSEVVLANRDAEVVASNDATRSVGDDLSESAPIMLALSGVRSAGTQSAEGGEELYVAVPVLSGPRTMGAVMFTSPAAVVDERVRDRLRGIVIAAAISLLLAAAIGFVLARTLTEPVRRLRRATRAIADGDLDTRADAGTGPPEIRGLADDFNAMIDRLERVVADQRDFAGDASHQLRTPLTTVQLRIDQMLDRIDSEDPNRPGLESARGELRRLERLVEGLLALARASGNDAPLATVPVSAIAQERFEAWEALAAEDGVALVTDIAPGLRARAVDGALEQIIDNYVANALEHAPAGSRVVLRALRRGNEIEVTVLDEGAGLTDAQLGHAFDRFWRAPDSVVGGSGVGLAVVQRLARASGGSATLRHNTPTGIVAVVVLRAADLVR